MSNRPQGLCHQCAFAVSTCCNALDIIFLAAAPLVAAISLAVTARELEQWLKHWYWLKTMSPYRPSIVGGVQRHAL